MLKKTVTSGMQSPSRSRNGLKLTLTLLAIAVFFASGILLQTKAQFSPAPLPAPQAQPSSPGTLTGTAGQIPFWSSTNSVNSTPGFTWDSTNGTTINNLQVANGAATGRYLSTVDAAGNAQWVDLNGTVQARFKTSGSGTTTCPAGKVLNGFDASGNPVCIASVPPAPTISLWFKNGSGQVITSATSAQQVGVSWNISDATSCTNNFAGGSYSPFTYFPGDYDTFPWGPYSSNTTFSITCSGPGGSKTTSVVLTVSSACTPESDISFCSRLGKNCGSVTGSDNCGSSRTVSSCGSCTSPSTCGGGGTANACGTASCTPESNATFCSRLGKNCGSVTGSDNCGSSRTVSSCGSCTSPSTCGGGGTANVCGGSSGGGGGSGTPCYESFYSVGPPQIVNNTVTNNAKTQCYITTGSGSVNGTNGAGFEYSKDTSFYPPNNVIATYTGGSYIYGGQFSATTSGLQCGVTYYYRAYVMSAGSSTKIYSSAPYGTVNIPCPASINYFTANPTSTTYGGSTYLSWSTNNATSCSASGGWSGSVGTSGSNVIKGPFYSNQVFYLTCTGPGGTSSTAQATLAVSSPPPPPSVSLSINWASSVDLWAPAAPVLRWNAANSDYCDRWGSWNGRTYALNGTETWQYYDYGNPLTFYIQCHGPGGSGWGNTASVTLNVMWRWCQYEQEISWGGWGSLCFSSCNPNYPSNTNPHNSGYYIKQSDLQSKEPWNGTQCRWQKTVLAAQCNTTTYYYHDCGAYYR